MHVWPNRTDSKGAAWGSTSNVVRTSTDCLATQLQLLTSLPCTVKPHTQGCLLLLLAEAGMLKAKLWLITSLTRHCWLVYKLTQNPQ